MKVVFNDREWDIDESQLVTVADQEKRQIVQVLESSEDSEKSVVVIAAPDGRGTSFYIAEVLKASWTEDGVRDHISQQLIRKDEPLPALDPVEEIEPQVAE